MSVKHFYCYDTLRLIYSFGISSISGSSGSKVTSGSSSIRFSPGSRSRSRFSPGSRSSSWASSSGFCGTTAEMALPGLRTEIFLICDQTEVSCSLLIGFFYLKSKWIELKLLFNEMKCSSSCNWHEMHAIPSIFWVPDCLFANI